MILQCLSSKFHSFKKWLNPSLNSKVDLVILDNIFPHLFSGFRIAEFNCYLNKYDNSKVLSDASAFKYINETRSFRNVTREYTELYPHNKNKIARMANGRLDAKLCYVIFLANIYSFLPLIEKSRVGFIFTLYPGGGFRLNEELSDKMLRTVFASTFFRKVIVTSTTTLNYLIDNNFCEASKIEFIYGVVTQSNIFEAHNLLRNNKSDDRKQLNLCFVAHKYTPQGKDKGYDTFIEVAHRLKKLHNNIFFHVIGSFNESDIDVTTLEDKIHFYGTLKTHEFSDIYARMDIILSPNSSFVMAPGAFDGFPTGACIEAGLNAVALFVTDDLKQNIVFEEDKEIVIVPRDVDTIVDKIIYFYNHPDQLKELGEKGKARIQASYNIDIQMKPRIALIEKALSELS